MWNRSSGKKKNAKDDVLSRRNGDDQRSTSTRIRSGSIVDINTDKNSSSRGDDRDRGFNPSSTSYSSTSRSPYPGTASASVASSYATATGNQNDQPYIPPGLERNTSLADQMPKSKSSRAQREEEYDRDPRTESRRGDTKAERRDSRDRDDQRKEKRNKRDKTEKDRANDRGLSRAGNKYEDGVGFSKGPADFPDQVGSAGFSQFPGQYDGALPGSTTADHSVMSSHVQDQFPGQFPIQSTAPYRPPLASTDGGPGLAAEYYGDAGESVAEQPGYRKHSPSLIIGAEPHLLPASAVANPPPEPSASGGVGAAASFFTGVNFESDAESGHGQQASSTYTAAPIRPDNGHHSSSAPIVPTIGGAAMGAAAGYLMGSQASSHQQRPDHTTSANGMSNGYSASMYQRPPSQVQNSHYSEVSRPPMPGKPSSQGSNVPTFAAAAAGAAGLAAATYHQSHHSSSQNGSAMYHPMQQQPTTPMAHSHRHRHHGPLGAVVDFFKDPDGVAQFEEYSEIVGTCRYCFAPGSSPRDAPRKHHYKKRRSNERLGSSTRIDKDSRYYSSENESRRKKDSSWLASGLAGYGLGMMGESLFKRKNDFDDTYSVKTGRQSSNVRSNRSRHRSHSNERLETGITSDGKIYRKDAHASASGGLSTTKHTTRRRSRSRSRDRKSNLSEGILGAAVGTTVAGATTRRRSRSPKTLKEGAWVKSRRRSQEHSPEHRHKSEKKKKKDKGFFSFMNQSSSSSSVDSIHPSSHDKRSSSKRSKVNAKDDHQKAEAALLGLGVAAAALALNDGRQNQKKKAVKELVGVKEKRSKHARVSSVREEDEVWESAPEDDQASVDSDLAYGTHARRGSRESLPSESSGTDKWGWRWGSKKKRRESPPKRNSLDHATISAVTGAAVAGLASGAIISPEQRLGNAMDDTSSLPLQHVYPVPTSDPTRFDVGRETSNSSSRRPGVVPIQHPQPITPVSQAVYSSQAQYEHSYSAPTGPPVFSQAPFQPRPVDVDTRSAKPGFSVSGRFPHNDVQLKDSTADFKLRRRDTSPARFGADAAVREMIPLRRASTKDDISAVRFDRTEEQEEQDRLERRRKRKEEKQRRGAEVQEQMDRDRKASGDVSGQKSDVKIRREKDQERSPEKSWVAPAAAGVAGAVIGAALVEGSQSAESREERRERRRREREREEAEEEEEANRRRERRRRERERNEDKPKSREYHKMPDEVKEVHGDTDRQAKSSQQEVWKPTTHEDYGSFFTMPPELVDKSTYPVKVPTTNADADVEMDRDPTILSKSPKKIRDRSASPVFSPADTDEKLNPLGSFPWSVPRLRLLEPTPPSSKGSTPIIRPKDTSDEDIEEPVEAPIEEPPRKPSTSHVTWGDDQTHEYTLITPYDEREELVESPPDERSDPSQVESQENREELESSSDRKNRTNGTAPSSTARTYDEDLEFAATLAASAEDAGFDPSIVIDDPTYRRRDSPPATNEHRMPGGFEDDDKFQARRTERKKEDKVNGQEDNAVVRENISQVEKSGPQVVDQVPADGMDENQLTRKTKSKKSKRSRKDSDSKDKIFESSESPAKSGDSHTRKVYESPPEDTRSTISSVPDSNDVANGKSSRRSSKRDSTELDDAASTMSSRSRDETANDSGSKSKDKSRGSLWSRVLGKPADSPLQKHGTKDVRKEAIAEDVDESKRKGKRSKERRSVRDEADDYDAASKSSESRERSRKQRTSECSTEQDSGRITQDLPTKHQESSRSTKVPEAGSVARFLIDDNDGEHVDEQQMESFLGERPKPPAPPDILDKEKEPPDPMATALPSSPPSRPYDKAQESEYPHTPESLQFPKRLSSPTAVPIHFRPPPPLGSPRSLPHTPLSSNSSVADRSPRQKPRPHSTEFRGAEDMRPLWLVERYNSHQEPASEETYPALPPSVPSSHTNSRASSIHDPEEMAAVAEGDVSSPQVSHDKIQDVRGLAIDTDPNFVNADLLDSQQTTPTACSFHRATTSQELPPSPEPIVEENDHTSSTFSDAVLGTAIGAITGFALHEVGQHDEPPRQERSREENENFQQGSNDMALESSSHQLQNAMARDISYEEDGQSQPVFVDKVASVDVGCLSDNELAFKPDIAFQKTKRSSKSKRKASKIDETNDKPSAWDAGPAPSLAIAEPQPSSLEDVREKQGQQAQDAVDTAYAPILSKKNKGMEKKGVTEELPSANELGGSTEPHRDDSEATEPASVQKTEALTREMSRNEVVRTMAAASRKMDHEQDQEETVQPTLIAEQAPREQVVDTMVAASLQVDQTKHEISQSPTMMEQATHGEVVGTLAATFQDMDQKEDHTTRSPMIAEQAPYEDVLEKGRRKPNEKKGKKRRQGLALDDSLPSSAQEISFVDSLTEQPSRARSGNSQLQDFSKITPTNTAYKLPMPTLSTWLDNPEATPLPVDDDLDLLDELPLSPIIEPNDQDFIHKPNTEFRELLEETRAQGGCPPLERPLERSRDPPTNSVEMTQSEQSDMLDTSASLSHEQRKKGEIAVSRSAGMEADSQGEIHLPTTAIQENQSQSRHVPSPVNEPVHDEPLIQGPLLDKTFIDKSVVDGFREESKTAEDERAGSSIKRGKDKLKSSYFTDTNSSGGVAEQPPLPVITPEKLEDGSAQDLVEKPFIEVPREDFRKVEDEWAGSGSKEIPKKTKKTKKQKSKTLDVEPESVQPEQADSEPSVESLLGDPAPLATTTTSLEVITMLQTENGKETTEPIIDEASFQSADADRELHGMTQEASPSADLSSRLEEEEAGTKSLEIQDPEIQDSKLHGVHDNTNPALGTITSPPLASSLASIDTGSEVHNILRGDVTSLSTDRQDEAASKTFAIAEQSTDKSLEAKDLDWGFPKKKKKGKKTKESESLPFDTPDITESRQFSNPPPEVETQLEPEPIGEAIDKPSSKKSTKDKKSKKKSLSRTASDYQDTNEPDVETVEISQNTRSDADALEAFIPSSIADTTTEEPMDSTALNNPKIPVDTDEISGFGLAQEQEIALPKSKKDKKKSKKARVLACEDVAASSREEELPTESNGLDEDIPVQAPPLESSALKTSEQMAEDRPKSKKDKKKAKKARDFSWKGEGAALRDDEPTAKTEGLEDEAATPIHEGEPVLETNGLGADAVEQATPLSDTGLGSLERTDEGRPRSKKDRKKAKKSQAFSWEGEDASMQSERQMTEEAYRKIEELPQRHVEDDVPIVIEKSLTTQQDVNSPVDKSVEHVSKDVLPDDSRAELVSSAPLGEQASNTQDETEVRRLEGTQAIIDPAAEIEEYPTFSLKKSKKDKKKGKKAQSSAMKEELQPEPTETVVASVAREDPHVPSIVPMSQDYRDWSREERLTEAFQPAEVIEPDEKLPDSRSCDKEINEDKVSRDGSPSNILDEVEPESVTGPVKRSKKSNRSQETKLTTIEPKDEQPMAGSTDPLLMHNTPGPTQDRESVLGRSANDYAASEHTQTPQAINSVPTRLVEGNSNTATVPDLAQFSNTRPEDELIKENKEAQDHDQESQLHQEDTVSTNAVIAHDPMKISQNREAVEDVGPSHTSTVNMPRSGAEIEISDPQGPRQYDEKDLEKTDQQDIGHSASLEKDAPDPVAEVEMMYAQREDEFERQHPVEREQEDLDAAMNASQIPQSPVTEVEMMYAQDEHEYGNEYSLGQEAERSQTLNQDFPTSTANIDALDPQKLHQHQERITNELERQNLDRPLSPSPSVTGNLLTPAREVEMLDPREQREYDAEYAKEFERQNLHRPLSPSPSVTGNLFTPAREVQVLDPREQREYDEEYTKELEQQNFDRPPSPPPSVTVELPTPAREVEMLNPREQREYNEEYTKELERQLRPADEGVRPYAPPDEVNTPTVPQAFENLMQPPYEEIHRPLARPPSLEDIIEETASRPGSVSKSSGPLDREAEPLPLKSTKSSKKGKKGKKSQQPVIWEDDTATPPPEGATESVLDSLPGLTAMPGSWETEQSQYPISLEQSIERQAVEHEVYTSPTKDLSSYRDSLGEHGNGGDYFSLQPTKEAEEGVLFVQPIEVKRATSTDSPRHVEDESLDQGPPLEQHDHQYADKYGHDKVDEVPERKLVEQHYQSRTESTSTDEQAHRDMIHAHPKKSKKGKMSKNSLGLLPGEIEQESSPTRHQLDESDEQAAHGVGLTIDPSMDSRESSMQRFSRFRAEPLPMHKEDLNSEERSGSTKDLAAAAAAAAGLGIGVIAAEGLSRGDSEKNKKKSKKAKNLGRSGDLKGETQKSANALVGEVSLAEDQQPRPVLEHLSSLEQQQSLATPPQPPSIPKSYESATTETRDVPQPLENPNTRDSAVHMYDSPVDSRGSPIHRVLRDSGYPETESSPIGGFELQSQNSPTTRVLEESYGREPEHDTKGHGQQRYMAEDMSDVNTRDYLDEDILRATPKDKRRRSTQRRSGTAYDSDDSNDSGFDIQRRRRRMQAMKDEGREPSPVSSTTKERSSELFGSSPSARQEHTDLLREQDTPSRTEHLREEPTWSFGPEASPQAYSRDASGETESTHTSDQVTDSSTYEKLTGVREEPPLSLFGGPFGHDEDITSRSMSPSSDIRGRRRLNTISEETSPLYKKEKRAISDVRSPGAGVKAQRRRSPRADDDAKGHKATEEPISQSSLPNHQNKGIVDLERSLSRNTDQLSRQGDVSKVLHKHTDGEVRRSSVASVRSDNSIHAIIKTPDQVRSASGQSFRSSGTPPLRRVDKSISGDLRGASLKSEAKSRAKSSREDAELDISIPSSSTYDPVTDKGKTRADMADVYVSPRSRTLGEHNVRKADLFKQEGWGDVRGGSPMSPTRPPSMRKRQSIQLLEYETRLDQLVSENRLLQNQKMMAERGLEDLAHDHSQQRHAYEEALQEQKRFLARRDSELNELKGILEEWQSKVDHLTEVNEGLTSSRGLDDDHKERYRTLEAEHTNLREQHTQLSTGMEDIVRHEVSVALEEKNLELRQLRDELERAKQQVRDLQQQLLASRSSDDFIERDEDYFDSQCQSLCGHVQQWVLRFSKFSDMKACYHPSEIRDEKVVDRVENAILDGTDVDAYLQDRVKRRDIFMSIVMTMIWEFIFTRYLFGMDREQRQKLKNLEKTLQEVGPMSAVHKWRATTLTLLMKREAFENQRATDTEAVVHEIYDTLATFLPPPSHFVTQVQESLRKVISAAVDLSIEMRTQRAEYSMLPPLQPEYDFNGDLARKVYFSALTMNERSGKTSSNEALQDQRAVVRIVLFPLVVKNEDDDEQVVVCPAQVLTADDSKGKGKSVRMLSAQGARSEASFAGTDVNMEGGMI